MARSPIRAVGWRKYRGRPAGHGTNGQVRESLPDGRRARVREGGRGSAVPGSRLSRSRCGRSCPSIPPRSLNGLRPPASATSAWTNDPVPRVARGSALAIQNTRGKSRERILPMIALTRETAQVIAAAAFIPSFTAPVRTPRAMAASASCLKSHGAKMKVRSVGALAESAASALSAMTRSKSFASKLAEATGRARAPIG